jgi:hypothetical protein
MKRIAIIAALVAITSCATIKPTERKVYTYVSDYTAYSQAGFLITPQPYHGYYESIGEIDMHITPAFEQAAKEKYGELWYTYGFETISSDEIVNMAVKQAVNMGADAISNFSITYKEIVRTYSGHNYIGYEYHVKGFCIKRK